MNYNTRLEEVNKYIYKNTLIERDNDSTRNEDKTNKIKPN